MILPENYVTCSISGRLGNNMFMVANAYARALDFGREFYIYKPHVIYTGHDGVIRDYSKTIFRNFKFMDVWEDGKMVVNPPFPPLDKPTSYMGYFQNEECFLSQKEAIIEKYSVPEEFKKRLERELPFLFTGKHITLISVRRGDYLLYPTYHPVLSTEYIHEAIKLIPQTEEYLIMSDDMEWCLRNIHIPNARYMNQGYSPEEQLWIMSLCNSFVISNSSFSWWGAYLSTAKDKVVVAPETWFGPEYTQEWKHMYCKEWLICPSRFENGKILPR